MPVSSAVRLHRQRLATPRRVGIITALALATGLLTAVLTPQTSQAATADPMPYPTRAVALYHMMWSNSGSPRLATTPANVNVVNLAFAQGDPPSLVGWASQSRAEFVADAAALRDRGVRIVLSVGGSGGQINVANRQAFVDGVMAINAQIPLDGLDWDLEGPSLTQSDVVWISTELKRRRGSNFGITMAPNGANIDQYRPVAVALHNAGALDMIGQQFYDAVVSKEAARSRVDQLVAAGIPESKVAVGMMVGPENTYWTVEECLDAVAFIKATHPNIRGGYLWEAGRAGTADWANRVGSQLLGGGTPGDTQPPTTPAGVQAAATSPTAVSVSWQASTDNVGVSAYRLRRGGAVAGIVAGTARSWQDTGLAPQTDYSYTVSALDAAGNESAQSPAATARTLAATSIPSCRPSALVAVGPDNNLYRWPLTMASSGPSFGVRAQVGTGWGSVGLLTSQGASGDLVAVNSAANLARYTWTGSAYTGGQSLSTGWSSMNALTSSGGGVVFARQTNGLLRWYRYLNERGHQGWAAGSGAAVGQGWDTISAVFGGGNGLVYAVRKSDGALLWYRYLNPLEPDAAWVGPTVIGTGWGGFKQLASTGGGHIFGVTGTGALMHYQHTGYPTGANTWQSASGQQVGSGWSGYTRLASGPADCGLADPPVNVRAYTGGNSIALRWNPPDAASPARYSVYRDGALLATVDPAPSAAYVNTARYVDRTAVRGTAHSYQVVMTTTSGLTSARSPAVSATLPATTTPVPAVNVTNPHPGIDPQVQLIRQTLVDWYPKLTAQLSYGRYSAPSTINVVIGQTAGGGGETAGNTITLDIDLPFFSNISSDPNFPGLVLHEASHVMQQYRNTPSWVTEGMAVYVTHTIFNDANTPWPSSGSYTSGYDNGAYLIKSAARWRSRPGLPADINAAGNAGSYSDQIFVNQTGAGPADLWAVVRAPRAIP